MEVIEYFERNQDKSISRVMTAILANYIEKSTKISALDYSRAVDFLTARSYISYNVKKYFENLGMDHDFLNESIEACDPVQILQLFETVANMLKSALNIQKLQEQEHIQEG